MKIKILFCLTLLFQTTIGLSATQKKIIGRVEWITLPDLKLKFKSRVDTGAKTNSLHAENIEETIVAGVPHVKFLIEKENGDKVELTRVIASKQKIKSTSGTVSNRYVIKEKIQIGNILKDFNINLNDRDKMEYKFLLGRNSLFGHFIVDVSKSHALGEGN
jgi:hypothetical protein